MQQTTTDDVAELFAREFELHIVASERARCLVLATVLSIILCLLLLLFVRQASDFQRISYQPHRRFWLPMFFCFAIFYELSIWHLLGALARSGRRISRRWRFAHAVVEVSFPTAGIVLFSAFVTPAEALSRPPPSGYFPLVLLTTLALDAPLCAFSGLLAGLEFLGLTGLFWTEVGQDFPGTLFSVPAPYLIKAVVLFMTGLMAGLVARELNKRAATALKNVLEQDRIRHIFGQHVSPEVADELLSAQAPDDSKLRHLCVLFFDIRGFTSFASTHGPVQSVELLNRLYGALSHSVSRHHGIINKFLGDGFMALFGAPIPTATPELHACHAAQEILQITQRLVAEGAIPAIRVGMGLHAGQAVTGSIGASQRKEYTVIGNPVNLASRIEGLNKQYGSQVLASSAVVDALPVEVVAEWNRSGVLTDLGPVSLRGASEPLGVYRLDWHARDELRGAARHWD